MRLGLHIGLGSSTSAGGGGTAVSGAAILAAGNAQALAIDFTDDFWQLATGHYGSAFVLDTGTPANNYDSHPFGKLTYTSPSAKMTMGPNGVLRFGAHNLYLNSASPANQSITVVSGATYSIGITGSVSVTASGAATGTLTAGNNAFTAATGTLTLGSTSGSGTVVVRRTPSDSTALATAGSARYALPFEWNSAGVLQGILPEPARTNLIIYSEQFNNAAWSAVSGSHGALTITANTTAAPDGTTTADTISDTNDSGSPDNHQVRTDAGFAVNSDVAGSVFLKAGTLGFAFVGLWDGSSYNGIVVNLSTGAITQTNGTLLSSSVTASGNGFWRVTVVKNLNTTTFLSICTSNSGTPSTSAGRPSYAGDGTGTIIAWGAQLEAGSFPTSYIPTIAAASSRNVDNITLAATAFPGVESTGTMYVSFSPASPNTGGGNYPVPLEMFATSDSTNAVALYGNTSSNWNFAVYSAAALQSDISTGRSTSLAANLAAAWALNDAAACANGGSVGTDASATMPASLSTLKIGSNSALSSNGVMSTYIKKVLVLPRRMTNADLQTLTT